MIKKSSLLEKKIDRNMKKAGFTKLKKQRGHSLIIIG